MFKSVLKEIGVSLLLFIAIVLVLSIVFYDYNPINKIIPNRVAYSTPESIKNEISENVTELEEMNVTYTIDGSDLEQYKRDKSYIAGKVNPFLVEENDENEQTDDTNTVDEEKTNTTEKNKTNTTDKDKTNTNDKGNTNSKTNSTTNEKTNTTEKDKTNTDDKTNITTDDKANTQNENNKTNTSSKTNTTKDDTQQGLWGNTGKK